ncbi:MAG: helix-turn-helix domain-containing protein [Microcoleus sp.]
MTAKSRPQLKRKPFSKKIGVYDTTVKGWEDMRTKPSEEHLEKLAHFAGITHEELRTYLRTGIKPDKATRLDKVVQDVYSFSPNDLMVVYEAIGVRFRFLAKEAPGSYKTQTQSNECDL